MHKQKRTFRGQLSFNKEELAGRIGLSMSGISMPILAEEALEEYRKDFSRQKDSLNFGMLGNDPKYYDRNAVSDIVPKPEDYVEVPFRLISATIVGGGTWKATDFSDTRILKRSTNLLDGVPLYTDHETDTNNWSGLVNGVKWTKSFTQDDGTAVPAGIDGIVAIDKVVNPKLARGVISGAVYSNSVTVEFDWEMSHQFENEWDFLNKLGTIGADGKMVRRIVTNIHNYHESSLVWLGADPFAKAIDPNGNLKNIDVGSVYSYAKDSFSKLSNAKVTEDEAMPTTAEEARNITVNFALSENVLSLARRTKQKFNSNTNDMKEFIVAFIATFGKNFDLKEGDQPTSEEMIGYMKKLNFSTPEDIQASKDGLAQLATIKGKALEVFKATEENKDATDVDMTAFMATHTFAATDTITSLTTSNTKLEQDKKDLETKVTQMQSKADLGEKFLGMKRTEAIRLYKLAVGNDNAEESVIKLFKDADDDQVDGLLKQYTKTATHKFKGTCSDCNSENFTFRSSFGEGDDGAGGNDKSVQALTTDDIYAKHNQPSMSIGRGQQQDS